LFSYWFVIFEQVYQVIKILILDIKIRKKINKFNKNKIDVVDNFRLEEAEAKMYVLYYQVVDEVGEEVAERGVCGGFGSD
jgi:hypothetical protein